MRPKSSPRPLHSAPQLSRSFRSAARSAAARRPLASPPRKTVAEPGRAESCRASIRNIARVSLHAEAGGLRSGPLPSAAIDSTGKVYVVWRDCPYCAGCDANDIVMSTSTDGETWSDPPQRIPIDSTMSGVDHFLPALAADPESGGSGVRLGVTYYYYSKSGCAFLTCLLNVGFSRVHLLPRWRSKLERAAATGWPHDVELAAGYVSGANGWRLYRDILGRRKGVQRVCSGVAAFGRTVSGINLYGRNRVERSRQRVHISFQPSSSYSRAASGSPCARRMRGCHATFITLAIVRK